MNFAQRIMANAPAPQEGGPEWVAVKPYEYDSEAKRMCILINPKDPFASSQSNLVFAEFTGNTLEFGIKWFIGGQDEALSIKFADGLDIDQVNYFYRKHEVPVDITIREICYLLTGIEDGMKQGPGGAPDENPQAPQQEGQGGGSYPDQHAPDLEAKPGQGPGPAPAPGPTTSDPKRMNKGVAPAPEPQSTPFSRMGVDPNSIGTRRV